jgi:hypothetical protein
VQSATELSNIQNDACHHSGEMCVNLESYVKQGSMGLVSYEMGKSLQEG